MDHDNDDKISALADQLEDRATLSSRGGGSSCRRNTNNPRRGGPKTSSSNSREVNLSRALSRLLRHQASNAGVQLDPQGFASLSSVLSWPPIRSLSPTVTVPEIFTLVQNSDKQRFALKPLDTTTTSSTSLDPKDWLIRANQGHSIKLDSSSGLLKPLALPDANGNLPDGSLPVPETVVHGTYFAFWPRILESGGLKRMGRNHVHCSTGVPEDEKGVVSGMRRDAELLVYVDVEKSMREEGMQWWVSENGVVLTEGVGEEGVVDVKWFKEVVGRTQGVGTLWKDGKWVADLPEGIKVRVPQGKGRGGGRGGRGRGRGRA